MGGTALQVQTYPVTFTGDAREYFRIWIVNAALSVVTLGGYTPWARIRTRQYFYGHTWVDGHNFDYVANPWALLRGYLIVAAFMLVYLIATRFPFKNSEYVVAAIAVLFVLVYPWLVRQSMRFLARTTVHRGISFRFLGSLGAAYLSYGLANIVALFSGGLGLPWALFMQRRFQVDGLAYGQARGHFRGDVGHFYLIALTAMGISIAAGVVFAALALGVFGLAGLFSWHPRARSDLSLGAMVGLVAAYLGLLLMSGVVREYMRAAMMRSVLNNVELGGVVRLGASFSPWMLAWISVSNYAAQLVSLGLLTPWAAVRRTKYVLEQVQVRAIVSLDSFSADTAGQESALGEAASELLDINLGF